MPNLKKMDPIEHARRIRRQRDKGDGWKAFEELKAFIFPNSPKMPPKPWHPDGDKYFRTLPTKKVDNSAFIIDHLTKSGDFYFTTGVAEPDYQGTTFGVPLNRAVLGDPEFTISKVNGPKNLCVITGYPAPYGKKVRIPKSAITQGYPANEISDSKLHIFDENWNSITEIQYCTDVSTNPILSGFLNFLARFGIGSGAGGLQCHGVSQYSLNVPSEDPSVNGQTSALMPLAEGTMRYDDALAGFQQMTGLVLTQGMKGQWVHPARSSDAGSMDPNAMKFGQILKLSPKGRERLRKYDSDPILKTIIDSWFTYGIMAYDTGGHNATGLEPDPRWPQDRLKGLADEIDFTYFEVWEQ